MAYVRLLALRLSWPAPRYQFEVLVEWRCRRMSLSLVGLMESRFLLWHHQSHLKGGVGSVCIAELRAMLCQGSVSSPDQD